MTLVATDMLAHIRQLLRAHDAVLCPECGKKLAAMLVGEAVFWCRVCKEYKLIRRDI